MHMHTKQIISRRIVVYHDNEAITYDVTVNLTQLCKHLYERIVRNKSHKSICGGGSVIVKYVEADVEVEVEAEVEHAKNYDKKT